MISLSLIFIILIGIASIIDLYTKKIPSVLLSTILLLSCILNPSNLFLGISAGIFAWLLFDFDFFRGIGDVKVLASVGFMLISIEELFWLMGLTVVLGVVWMMAMMFIGKEKKEVAFLPVFLFAYITVLLLRGQGVT